MILVGGPDTGKTNFIGRLWLALRTGKSRLVSADLPQRIDYVQEIVAHLHQGSFAPRTDKNTEVSPGEVVLPVKVREYDEGDIFHVTIPDVSGEIWQTAVESNDLAPQWMRKLETAVGAILFVRVLSELNVDPVNWVTAARLMAPHGDAAEPDQIPTQVMLCELLRFLEDTLHREPTGHSPRVAVVVTACDLLDREQSRAGPQSYLQAQYPLFAGRLADIEALDVMVFGISILGGDLAQDSSFRTDFLASDGESAGYTLYDDNGVVRKSTDLTLPLHWVIGEYQTTT